MAVDTRDKRASAVGFCLAPRFAPPFPDGSLASQGDRQHIAYSYRGILAGGGGGGGGLTPVLTVVDLGDGTAEVSQSGTSSANIYRASIPLPGVAIAWVLVQTSASENVDYVVTGAGLWLWRAVSAGTPSDPVYQPVADPSDAITDLLLTAVRDQVRLLGLAGLSSTEIIRQWTKQVFTDTDTMPRCVVCPSPEPPDAPTRNLSFMRRSFAILVLFVEKTSKVQPRRLGGTPVTWKDRAEAYWLNGNTTIPTVQGVELIQVGSGPALDQDALDMADLVWSAFTLKIRVRRSVR